MASQVRSREVAGARRIPLIAGRKVERPDIPDAVDAVSYVGVENRVTVLEILARSEIDHNAEIITEGVQADLFDHLIASLERFDLRPFQLPTGADLASLSPPSAGAKS